MLVSIFGNKSAVKVMHHLYLNEEVHASQIANHYNTALDPIRKQLERFHEAKILKSRMVGRMRLYLFNKEHPLYNSLMEIINISLNHPNKETKHIVGNYEQ